MKKVIISIAIASLLSASAWANTELVSSSGQSTAVSAVVDAKSAQFSQADISAVLGGASTQSEVGVMTQEQMTATDGASPAKAAFLAGLYLFGKAWPAIRFFIGQCGGSGQARC